MINNNNNSLYFTNLLYIIDKLEENQKQPATGELIILRASVKGTVLMSFGYVQSVRDNPKFHKTYLTIDTDASNKFLIDSPTQIAVVSSIYYQLGPFHALSILNESPLINSILQPLENIVMPAKYPDMDYDGCVSDMILIFTHEFRFSFFFILRTR